jgi:hypothetical protein
MLSNTIVLNDGVDDASYDLVSRSGMTSLRREVGVDSSEGSSLKIANTVDITAPETKNRHLVQLSWTDYGTNGEPYPASVHVVVTRHKMVDDAKIKLKLVELADLISTSADVEDILLGGN